MSRAESAYVKHGGVRTTEELDGFPEMLRALHETFDYPAQSGLKNGLGNPALRFGGYANVIDLGNGTGIAISTDGVGTKILVARALNDYTTIGIDCVAMNVNDVICVGATPLAMTDYLGVADADPLTFKQIAAGLKEGARLANISIPGGEVAQIRELVREIDLVGTCVGIVRMDEVIDGRRAGPGDAVIGYSSSGIHSNGLTMARRLLTQGDDSVLKQTFAELGRTLGQELLAPTHIYARLASRLREHLSIHGMAHITSDGFVNLKRINLERQGILPILGFRLDNLPDPPAIFRMIQEKLEPDRVPEMYTIYNMGVGLCVVVAEDDAQAAMGIGYEFDLTPWRIGTCVLDDSGTVELTREGLRSVDDHFVPV